MRKGFFESDRNFEALKVELRSWKGTPNRPRMAMKGVGADCVNFVHTACYNIGALPMIHFPKYVTRGGGPETLTLMRDVILSIRNIRAVWAEGMDANPIDLVRRGDMVVISSGKALHHLIIVEEPPRVWHCFKEVDEGSIMDSVVINHMKNIFRIYA